MLLFDNDALFAMAAKTAEKGSRWGAVLLCEVMCCDVLLCCCAVLCCDYVVVCCGQRWEATAVHGCNARHAMLPQYAMSGRMY